MTERGHAVLTTRFLAAQDREPALEFVESVPDTAWRGAPILFIHGAFAGAWMWRQAFLPVTARSGRRAAAVSLRGHGGSAGGELLSQATLADYARDVCRALAEFEEAPIIVAHSLGALLAQRLLGARPMRALVLLTPLPPEGLLFTAFRTFATEPELWLETVRALSGTKVGLLGRARQALFSDRISAREIDRVLSLMVTEGARVLLDAHVPRFTVPAFFLAIPTLVVAGAEDQLVRTDTTLRTALYHGGDHLVIDGAGHLLSAEPEAENTAQTVLDWLDRRGL